MLKLRTKLLLSAIAFFGIGIVVLSHFTGGAYSALCLFVLPLFVALAALSIIADFNAPHAVKMTSIALEEANSIQRPTAFEIPATMWTKPALEVTAEDVPQGGLLRQSERHRLAFIFI